MAVLYKPRAFGGAVPYSTGITTNAMSGTESLVGSDVLLVVLDPSPGFVEANTGTDSSQQAGTFNGVEANSGVDVVLYAGSAVLVETNTGSDALSATGNAIFVESNTGSDALQSAVNTTLIEANAGS